jgi:hypothetical protein
VKAHHRDRMCAVVCVCTEDFAHEFKDVARNKKEHYFAIINHPKLEANLSAFLNSRDGGTTNGYSYYYLFIIFVYLFLFILMRWC